MAPPEHREIGSVAIDGDPDIVAEPHALSMVYGGGGPFGIAYGLGVATGLAEAGIDVAGAPSLGTSAGSWVASAMALGLGYDAFDGMVAPSVPTRRDVLVEIARDVFGRARHHLVAVSAVRVPTGRRHILDGERYDLADLIAASSAVPGLFPPHEIEGRAYVDGGMWSATSVDAAREARHVIVVAPLAGPVLGPMGRTAGVLLGRELDRWRRRHQGGTIAYLRPNRAIGRILGRSPMNLFDSERAHATYPLALEQGREWGERLAADLADGARLPGRRRG
ncbi:MAG: patatin-like phospholipase family protein [Acidimicrobiales bacterium]|nr:patatin-like phospholipase family protein [Acidimicrobiales bacterium]HRW36146.1 patatin-like phospholipase family protein [Aquihabitans sp.]